MLLHLLGCGGMLLGLLALSKRASNCRCLVVLVFSCLVGLLASAGRGFSPPTCIVLYCCFAVDLVN